MLNPKDVNARTFCRAGSSGSSTAGSAAALLALAGARASSVVVWRTGATAPVTVFLYRHLLLFESNSTLQSGVMPCNVGAEGRAVRWRAWRALACWLVLFERLTGRGSAGAVRRTAGRGSTGRACTRAAVSRALA